MRWKLQILAKTYIARCSKTEFGWRLNQIFEAQKPFQQSGVEIK